MYAVVSTGGKQLRVATGDVVTVEKLDAAVGDTVKFDVILLADEGEVTVDSEALAATIVTGEVIEQFKGEKAVVFKFKRRKGYRRLNGHRQNLTRVRITDIAPGDPEKAAQKKRTAPKKRAVKKAEVPVVEATEVVEKPEAPETVES